MALMIAGLVLFLGVHLVPTAPTLRSNIVSRFGERPYRTLFSAISAVGLMLVIVGYHMRPERMQLFAPFHAARAAAPALVTIAFVLLVAANLNTHIRRISRNPMLIGLMLWSAVHLLANGDVTGTILFGSIFAYSVVDLFSVVLRGRVKRLSADWRHDAAAITIGLLLAYLTIRFHASVFGTGPVT